MLQLWAFLDHQDVWYKLFSCRSRGCTECHWLQELGQSEVEFKRVVRTLFAYSLIEPYRDLSQAEGHPSSESYSVHPVGDENIKAKEHVIRGSWIYIHTDAPSAKPGATPYGSEHVSNIT